MKREELLEKGYTEEQVTELLDMFHKNNANLSKENEGLKAELDTAKEKIAGLSQKEAELNAMKQAQLSEDEKLAIKQKEIEANLAQSRITLNTAKAKEVFSSIGGIDDETLATIVTDNLDETLKRANNWVEKINNYKTEASNKTREELSAIDTKPTPSNDLDTQAGMTWEKFDSMSADEQTKFAEEHPDIVAKL